jgi:2-polyprenyl-3-methyl-5-hydroxy-6-metoxy-1,4-benzoquinol methylase
MPELTRSQRDAWDGSATRYATFASQSRLYQETAAALVRLAGIKPGMTVVDLACGSGIVTESVLRRMGAKKVTIVATDFSAEMIAVARERIPSTRVRFRCEAAEQLSQTLDGPVDRVLCNAAFWQFDRERAAVEIVKVLKPSGKCLLTLPDWSAVIDEPDAQYEKHKLLWMIREELFMRGHKFRKPAPRTPATGLIRPSAAALRFANDSVQVEKIERIAVNLTAQDHFEFLRIPVMLRQLSEASGVSDDELRDILTVVRNQLVWVNVDVPPQIWQVVVLKKTTN